MTSKTGFRNTRIFSMGGAVISVNDAIGECAAMVNIPLSLWCDLPALDLRMGRRGEMGLLAEAMVVSSLY